MLAALATAAGAILFSSPVTGQSLGALTYCNPIDIDYKYNFEQINEGISYRSGADPVIINHRGEYFLFVTVSGGYWHSKEPPRLAVRDPEPVAIRGDRSAGPRSPSATRCCS